MATADTTTAPVTEQPSGIRGQIAGHASRAIDAVAGVAGRSGDPRVGQAKAFAAKKPLALAALAGVVGLAVLNTVRGRR